jgi:dihydroxyacetone kinase-like protein
MKKLINAPADAVVDSLRGFAEAHRALVVADLENLVCLTRSPLPSGQVALVSGGGSGHEPLHAGFVGDGMLTAAVLGDIFASPTADQVLAACTAADAGGGVLLVVKNYTGDVLNFRLAAELAEDEDIEVAVVIVDDDAALARQEGSPGRRGTAATVLVEKIAGALAAEGASLADVAALAERVVGASRSIGFALTSCTTPMAGRPTFDLAHDEVEFGVGIHGEQGLSRQALTSAAELAEQAVELLVADLRPPGGAEVLVLTNGLGGTPESELYLLHGDVTRAVRDRGLEPSRQLVGSFVTSLDMAGASLSLLVLDDELTRLWDAPAATPAFPSAAQRTRA